MALTLTYTAMTWASGSATATGVTNAVDLSAAYVKAVYVKIAVSGSPTVGASFTVDLSADAGTTYLSRLGPFTAGLVDATTYYFGPIAIEPACSSVKVNYTAQTGGTSSTITLHVSRMTAL
jgi:hypothetical protein